MARKVMTDNKGKNAKKPAGMCKSISLVYYLKAFNMLN